MIKGKLYQAGSSDALPATLSWQNNAYFIEAAPLANKTGTLKQLSISNRLGQIARKLTLPDGTVFETEDNDAVDALLASTKSDGIMRLVHKLEQNMLLAFFSIFIIAGVLFSSIKWGLPLASQTIADALPESANQALSTNVLEFLDEHLLEASQLPIEQQEELRQHFMNSVVPLYQAETPPDFQLHFRLWPIGDDGSIANALALPSGDIIVTDRFIQLSQTQDEIDIVLLHEMGHVVERHSLEQVIEGSALAIGISIAFGDVSWLADVGIGVGSFFISSFYSRGHETEADEFAYRHSLKAGIDPSSLGNILFRMEQDMSNKESCPVKTEQQESGLEGYFSTHPSSSERTLMGKHYLSCFEKGIIACPKYELK